MTTKQKKEKNSKESNLIFCPICNGTGTITKLYYNYQISKIIDDNKTEKRKSS